MSRRAKALLWFGVYVQDPTREQFDKLFELERAGRVELVSLPAAATDTGVAVAQPQRAFKTEEMGVLDIGLTLPPLDVRPVADFIEALDGVFGEDHAMVPVWRLGAVYV